MSRPLLVLALLATPVLAGEPFVDEPSSWIRKAGDTTPPAPSATVPVVRPTPALPGSYPEPAVQKVARVRDAHRLNHLLEAARHLEAAGRTELAAEIRQSVRVEQRIAEKQQQIAKLQRELAELQRAAAKESEKSAPNEAEDARKPQQPIRVDISWIELGERSTKDEANAQVLPWLGRVVGVKHEAPAAKRPAHAPVVTIVDGAGIDVLRDLFTRHGAKTICQPTVITTAGREARILTGGEFAIPVPNADGTTGVEFREFGHSASITPTLAEGRIDLDLVFEVSERDFENAVSVRGVTVPGLSTSRAAVKMSLPEGRAGLLIAPHPNGTTQLLLVEPSRVEAERPQEPNDADEVRPVESRY